MFTRSTCALVVLCLVQGCERFAFFAMMPLFIFYLQQRHGFTESAALLLLGVFQAFSYIGGLPAGAVTDWKLDSVTGTLLGAVLLTLGYGTLALDRGWLLWPALALMVVGHSFFKPNIIVLLDRLFPSSKLRRDRGFLLHHLAVNLGALAGPWCVEWYRFRSRWTVAFFSFAVATFIGAMALALNAHLYESSRRMQPKAAPTASRREEWPRWHAVKLLCVVAIVFWLTSQQAGSTLILFAEGSTEHNLLALGRHLVIGPGHFASLHALLVLGLMPLLTAGLAWLRRRYVEPSASSKMIWGYLFTASAFTVLTAAGLHGGDTGRVSPVWLVGCFLMLSVAELLLAPLGLSLLTRIAPQHRTSQTVGLWFAASAAGNGLAGILGLLWERWPHHRYFGAVALIALAAALVLLSRLTWLDGLLESPRRHVGGRR